MNIKSDQLKKLNFDDQENVDFEEIKQGLLRNKNLIIKFTLSGLIISILLAFITRKTWQGEFQIVLSERESSNLLGNKFSLPENLLGNGILGGGSLSSLRTEIGILKSPSVLMKIYDYVKSEKLAKKDYKFDKVRFNKWKNDYLKIKLEKGTKILNITYKDYDKKSIVPVLNRISKTYQDYSGKQRNRDIDLILKYSQNQKDIYEQKSKESTIKLKLFELENNLINQTNYSPLSLNPLPGKTETNIIDENRFKLINQNNFLRNQLKKLENLEKKSDEIIYLSKATSLDSQGFSDEKENIFNLLDQNQFQLSELRISYKDNDPFIKKNIRQREDLLDILRSQTIIAIESTIKSNESKLSSLYRPNDVLVEHTKLIIDFERDKSTLKELDNYYKVASLEKAKYKDPWELITKPTLLPKPVGPIKRLYAILGLASGLVTGIVASFIIEKRNNIVFSLKTIENECNSKVILNLPFSQDSWEESLKLLSSGLISKLQGNIAIISVSQIEETQKQSIKLNLEESYSNGDIKIINSLLESRKSQNVILLIKLANTSKDKILDWEKKIQMQNNNLIGIIVLD